MGLYDDVLDVEEDIDKLCPKSTKESFASIVEALWRFEAELEELQSKYNKVLEAVRIIQEDTSHDQGNPR